MGELVPRGCISNALPVDNGLGLLWALDGRHLQKALQGLLVEEQAKEGGVAMVEEEDKEEDRRPSAAGRAVPL